MTATTRQRVPMRHFITTAAVVTVLSASAALLAPHAFASTGITITSGGCSGGGSAYCFTPESATATVGSPVTWTNQSGAAHTVTSCTASACSGAPANTGSNTFNLSLGAGAGSTGSFTFTSPGTYTYYCVIHLYAGMHGTITVTAAPATPTASAAPTATGPAAHTPGTGGAPGPLGGVTILAGMVLVLLALAVRRR